MQDHRGQQPGLAGPRRGHHQDVLLHRHPQLVPPVGPADTYRVLPRPARPLPGGQRPPGPAGGAERRQSPPPPPQGDRGREAAAGMQPQEQPQFQVADPMRREPAFGDEAEPHQRRECDRDAEEDQCLHAGLASPCAARTALRSAVRAAPGVQLSLGARSRCRSARRQSAGCRPAGRAAAALRPGNARSWSRSPG